MNASPSTTWWYSNRPLTSPFGVGAGVERERPVHDLDAERIRQRDRPVGAAGRARDLGCRGCRDREQCGGRDEHSENAHGDVSPVSRNGCCRSRSRSIRVAGAGVLNLADAALNVGDILVRPESNDEGGTMTLTDWRYGAGFRGGDDGGQDRLPRLARRVVGGPVLASEGLHPRLHDRARLHGARSSRSSTSATSRSSRLSVDPAGQAMRSGRRTSRRPRGTRRTTRSSATPTSRSRSGTGCSASGRLGRSG